MARRTYSIELKAQAVARVLAGETVSEVARDLNIDRTALHHWLAGGHDTGVIVAITPATRARDLEARLGVALDTILVTLTRQAEHYGSEGFITKESVTAVLESTRTLGSIFVRIMDRLKGQPGGEDDCA